MSAKRVIPRELVNRDVEAALDHYLEQGSEGVALEFVVALERAYQHVAQHPSSGSSRQDHELYLPGPRFWPLKRYPYFVIYLERETLIDPRCTLHAECDIPDWMEDPDVS